ncbi:tetratricopeptide repeat protein [Colwellia sp. MSW7]|uniref:Tetratricopeptide repeat protein n=1 Tax=Colwellia maritima TaxID=2912588 RepID=A0ABS9WZE9_9GAMM|nr:tetratricopeptide repeat protein [Colwellia maritima]MCI2282212.1 tetratricopeptide repeat protein [Colwellia maritima]
MNSKKSLLPLVLSVALAGGLVSCSQNKTIEENLNDAQIYLQQNKTGEAIISLKNILKEDANNIEARFLLGKSYINQGNWVVAEKELNRAKKYNYDSNLVYPLLAEAFSHLEDSSGIELLLNDVVDNNSLEQSVRYFLAVTYVYEEAEIKALSEFDTVVSLGEDTAYGQLGQAWLYGIRKQFDKGAEIANKLIESELYSAISLELLAKTYFSAKKMELAAKSFKAYLQLRSQDHQNRLMYAIALAEFFSFDEAEIQADFIMEISPNNVIANQIKAQARFAANDFKEAKKFAENAIKGPGAQAVSYIVAGVSAYQLNQLEVAHTHLMSIKDSLSYQHPARKLLIQIRFQLGYSDENFNDLSNAPNNDLDTLLLSESAQELFKIGKINEAENLIDKANKIEPENARIIYRQGVLKLLNKDDSAIEFFKLALKKNPELDAASLILAMELAEDKKYNEAFDVANELQNRNPQLAFSLIGAIYNHQGKLAESKKAFNRVLALNEKHIGAIYNLGIIAQQENDLDSAVTYYQQILDINPQHLLSIKALLTLSRDKALQEKIKQDFENRLATTQSEPATIALTEYYLIQQDYSKAKSIAMVALKSHLQVSSC